MGGCPSRVMDAAASTSSALRAHARAGRPVLFLDHESSREELYDTPTYVVASGLWPFLRLLLMDDLEMLDWEWPFDDS